MTWVVWFVTRLVKLPLHAGVHQTPLVWFGLFFRRQVECQLALRPLQRLLVLVTVFVRPVSPLLV